MEKLLYPVALVLSLACGVALGSDIALTSFVSCGIYDTAEIQNVAGNWGLVNTQRTDAVYSTTLDFSSMQSPHLTVDISVSLGASSNAVWLGFGNSAISPDYLRIGCEEGIFTILMGDQLQDFDAPPPPSLEGDAPRTFRIHIVTSIEGNYSSTVKIYEDGNLQPSTLRIDPSLWQGAGGDPSTWDTVTVSLRGKNSALLSPMQCGTVKIPTRIFIR